MDTGPRTLGGKRGWVGGELGRYILNLLPAGSEEQEVLQTGSIHVATLPYCQSFTTVGENLGDIY